MNKNQQSFFSPLRILVWTVILVLVSLILWWSVFEPKAGSQANPHLKTINNINLSQSDDALKIAVEILGSSDNQYRLSAQISSSNYVKAPLKELSDIAPLKYDRQTFNFEVPFKDLEEAYYREVINYIPVFKRKFEIEELITIEISLKLLEPGALKPGKAGKPDLQESRKAVMARFLFVCQEGSCKITQEGDDDPGKATISEAISELKSKERILSP